MFSDKTLRDSAHLKVIQPLFFFFLIKYILAKSNNNNNKKDKKQTNKRILVGGNYSAQVNASSDCFTQRRLAKPLKAKEKEVTGNSVRLGVSIQFWPLNWNQPATEKLYYFNHS